MKATIITFGDYVKRTKDPEAQFPGHYPEWPLIDRMGSSIYRDFYSARLILHSISFCRALVAVPVIAYTFYDGPDPRRHCQLVRPQVRLYQL
jgi:hypothetical protein